MARADEKKPTLYIIVVPETVCDECKAKYRRMLESLGARSACTSPGCRRCMARREAGK